MKVTVLSWIKGKYYTTCPIKVYLPVKLCNIFKITNQFSQIKAT